MSGRQKRKRKRRPRHRSRSIKVEKEPIELGAMGLEPCCICWKPTSYWHKGNDVACCPECAKGKEEADLPTKAEWFEAAKARKR